MPRFLHTTDCQIGRQYSQFHVDDAVPMAEARLAAVETIARLAVEHKIDAVLVAGEVIDAQTVADRTIRKLFNVMQGYAGPWLMIPGNREAKTPPMPQQNRGRRFLRSSRTPNPVSPRRQPRECRA